MVISEKDLQVVGSSTTSLGYYVRHALAGVQLYTSRNTPNQTFVQTIDAIGNVKTSKEYQGFQGFWQATMEFERIIAERLNLEEIIGYQVGDIVFIEKPVGNLRKGDAIAITEISPDGLKIKKFIKLDKQELKNAKKSGRLKQLVKNEELDFLAKKGITSLSELEPDKQYDFDLAPQSVTVMPITQNYRGFEINEKYEIDILVGGGDVTLQNIVLETDVNGKTQVKGKVLFEDGSDGVLSLNVLTKK
jgi:hypothetical protein